MPLKDLLCTILSHSSSLHLANLILGDDGQLWVIDWGCPGWYPAWFEAASMALISKMRPEDHPHSWSSWIPFMAGSYDKPGRLPFIMAIAYSLGSMRSEIMNLVCMHSLCH